MSELDGCEDFKFKNPHPIYRCKKGHDASMNCIMCANFYDASNSKKGMQP